jgi:hypothetical protein
LREIIKAYEVERVSETYHKPIEITDLKDALKTDGHILIIRGDEVFLYIYFVGAVEL